MHMRGRLVHRISPEDVGRRVSVRIRLPEGGFTDIVGVVESWDDGVLTVRRRDGSVAEVGESTVAASRVVPPVPPRRRGGRPPQAP
ncbi:putative acetyltransferase [Nocardiopsis quinghaiensis]|uniref:putative acetyltransferase n=1 Tax=Nocardiopsis quinghaiensis TaxID=464995 RepID=UPI00123B84B7|nr:hypothetical protein [Nocardiopsis quinghaiensis]